MKILCAFLLAASLACAADKRYVVCLVAGSDEQCTKPLTKDASEAVYAVFVAAPIGGLDAVYIEDVKTKKMVKGAKVQPADQPLDEPSEPLHGSGEIKL
jgi:hypothetical protein